MAEEPVRISKPRRWDVPFGNDMTEANVELLMQQSPFNRIDQSKFPSSAPLRDILLNDAQLRHFENGDIVVREGDYGNSAFFIVTGAVQVILDSLPARMLGRRESQKKNFFQAVAQLWERPRYPEVRIYAFGHVGDGNIHYNVGPERLVAERPAVNRIVYDTVAELGGSISAEHGLGQLKRDEIRAHKSPLEMELMRSIGLEV